jgi:hypothetical protein
MQLPGPSFSFTHPPLAALGAGWAGQQAAANWQPHWGHPASVCWVQGLRNPNFPRCFLWAVPQVELVPLETPDPEAALRQLREECIPGDTSATLDDVVFKAGRPWVLLRGAVEQAWQALGGRQP